jgi:hypothetical protein
MESSSKTTDHTIHAETAHDIRDQPVQQQADEGTRSSIGEEEKERVKTVVDRITNKQVVLNEIYDQDCRITAAGYYKA